MIFGSTYRSNHQMILKKVIFIITLIFIVASSFSQVAINTDGSEANASAMLDVDSENKGVLVPRMTSTQRTNISNPGNGLLVFDETTKSFWFYDNNQSDWVQINVGNLVQGGINDLNDGKTSSTSIYLGNNSGTNSSGDNNNSMGINSLFANTNGQENTAIGYESLSNNTIGNYNIAIGTSALGNNQTGEKNTAIGYQAGLGSSLHNSIGNIFLGYKAGYHETGNWKLYIENSDSNTPLIGGDFDNDTLAIAGDLSIYGDFLLSGGSPSNGKVLITDEEGNASWSSLANQEIEINDLIDGRTYNRTSTYLGYESGSENSTGEHNTALGYRSLDTISTGAYNSAIGAEALKSLTIGSYNTVAGRSALSNLVDGSRNIAIGYEAGANNINGSGNIFIGYQAGKNETGSNKLYIDDSCTSTPLIYGDFDADSLQINGLLSVYDKVYYDVGNKVPGRLLVSQGNGCFAWDTISLTSDRIDGIYRSDEYNSITISTNSSYDDNNTIIGYVAAWTVGYGPAGSDNTIFGAWANFYNNEMNKTVTLGSYAGPKHISSHPIIDNNIYIGHKAGYYSGSGENMLYIENHADSLYLISGDFDEDTLSVIGDLAIYGNLQITGGNPGMNKALISDADGNASWQSSGNINIAINDLSDAISDNYSVFLGYHSGTNDDGTANRNTSMGVSSMYTNTSGYYNTSIGYNSLYSNNSGDYNVAVGYEALKANTGNQNVAIGYQAALTNSNFNNSISVGYKASAPGSNSAVIGNTAITQIGGYAPWSNLSDKRFKNNIQKNVAGIDFIMKLRPVTYQMNVSKLNQFLGIKEDTSNLKSIRQKESIRYSGFIAQEVEQAALDVNYDFSGVTKPLNKKGHYSLAYAEFVVPLVKAMQEQMEEIEQNDLAIDQLKQEIEILKQQILFKLEDDKK